MKTLSLLLLLLAAPLACAQKYAWNVATYHASHFEQVTADGAGGCVAVARGIPPYTNYKVMWISNNGSVRTEDHFVFPVKVMMVTPTRFYVVAKDTTNGPNYIRRYEFKKGAVTTTDTELVGSNVPVVSAGIAGDKTGFFVCRLTPSEEGTLYLTRYRH